MLTLGRVPGDAIASRVDNYLARDACDEWVVIEIVVAVAHRASVRQPVRLNPF